MGRRLTSPEARAFGFEFLRFVGVGVANTAATYALFLGLNLVLHYQVAYGIAYATGVAISYALNTRWVFRRKGDWVGLLAFPLVYLVPYAINLVLLHALVELWGVSEWLAPAIVIVVSVPITFVLARLLIRSRGA
jgi:putative flippase GtrA